MSVASGKKNEAWREWMNFRHYGDRGPGEFSLREKLLYAATSAAARTCIRMWTDTCHWEIHGDRQLRRDLLHERTNYIFVCWHNRVPGFFAYLDSMSRRRQDIRMHSIISASKDGEFLARPIRENGGYTIRGSSSRDAAKALREGIAAASVGSSINTVGDGPRGPRYKLKPGPIMLAKATGLPIIPVSWSCNRTAQLHRSWDQMIIPLPFSRIEVRFGEPFKVAAEAGPRDVARARRELEKRLEALTDWADGTTRIRWQIPKPKPGELLKRRTQVELEGRHFEE
ncbi:MAG: lysophospholipid acyltransferase family protein [Planctomycetes bacterium]|nr:lysophospholipid acyltransferase family protein [Planctomycetota bacterium]